MRTLYLFISCLSISVCLKAEPPGTIDTTFNSVAKFNGPAQFVERLPNGKLLVGGMFTNYGNHSASKIARLNSDGSLDLSFQSLLPSGSSVSMFKSLPNGQMLVSGNLTTYGGTPVNKLIRLNTDGTLDNSFNVSGTGPAASISDIIFQNDGKILLNGVFSSYNGTACNGLVRINPDGSLDNTLNIGTSYHATAVAIANDGNILLAGLSATYQSQSCGMVIKIDLSGNLMSAFNSPAILFSSFYSAIRIIPKTNGKIIVAGTTKPGSTYSGVVILNNDGTIDNSFTSQLPLSASLSGADTLNDGRIVVCGSGLPGLAVELLKADGSIDGSFIKGSVPNSLYGVCALSDNTIIAIGFFHSYNNFNTGYIVKVNTDGTISSNFKKDHGASNDVNIVVKQPDEKILIGGAFTSYDDVLVRGIARLDKNGFVDLSFNIGTGTNGTVYSIVVQPDNKIIVAGTFTSFNTTPVNNIVRLNPDGSIDNTFNPVTGADNSIYSAALQSDGKIIIGGMFLNYNGSTVNKIARLKIDGSLDNTFNTSGTGFSIGAQILKIKIDQQDNIFVGGNMAITTQYNGNTFSGGILKLMPNGQLDNSFNKNSTTSYCWGIEIQKDGKVLVAGSNTVKRLDSSGNPDPTFAILTTDFTPSVRAIALSEDEKIYVGGQFTACNTIPFNRIIRLNPNGTIDYSFALGAGFNDPYIGPNVYVNSILVLPSTIIVGGHFVSYNQTSIGSICRIHSELPAYNSIRGHIANDLNQDCSFQNSDLNLPYYIVKAEPGPYYSSSDEYGNYQIKVDTGSHTYTVTQQWNKIQQIITDDNCNDAYSISLTGSAKDTASFDFHDNIKECTMLNISIGNNVRRRCFRSSSFVTYSNDGALSANDVFVKVIYPPYIKVLSAVPIWSYHKDSVYIFQLGTLGPNSKGLITIQDSVICGNQSVLGLTQCVKAVIGPQNNCETINNLWDRSLVAISGTCNKGVVTFNINNSGTGNMTDSSTYKVFINDTLIYEKKFKLLSNSYLPVTVNADGKTIRVEANQSSYCPGNKISQEIIEGCINSTSTSNVSTGYVLSAIKNDEDAETAINCSVIRGSYDPNKKAAFPSGVGINNIIKSTDPIKYTIHFQNTGSDTAFSVRVTDTLDTDLDIFTLSPGASSYPYRMLVSGKTKPVVTFYFDEINLPDSSTNKVGSNGFVNFTIYPIASSANQTVITNEASIYFDYNNPVLTNITTHTIDNSFENVDPSRISLVHEYSAVVLTSTLSHLSSQVVNIYPNPLAEKLTIQMNETINFCQVTILSVTGTKIIETSFSGSSGELNTSDLKPGFYIVEIKDDHDVQNIYRMIKK